MANQIIIDIGAVANDGTGDPLRTAFGYVNDNFSNVWATGVANSNIQFSGNKILTVNTNGNLVLAPNGTGKVQANVDIVPNANNTLSLGAIDKRWNTVYARNLDVDGNVTFAGDITISSDLVVDGNLTVNGTTTSVNTTEVDIEDKVITIAYGSPNASAANGSGITVGGANANIIYNQTANAWTFNIGVSSTGNVTGGNLLTSGLISTSGNIIGNLVAPGGNQDVVFNRNGLLGTASGFNYNYAGNILYAPAAGFSGDLTTGTNGLFVGRGTFTVLGSDILGQFTGNVNAYSQINSQNTSNGAAASGDYVITADNGTDSTHFINLGMTSSNWDGTQPNSLGNRLGPNDGYLYVQDGDMVIGTNNGSIYTWKFDTAGNLTVPGNVVPAGNNTQNLGSASYQWNDLYLSNATIYMNSVPLSMTAGNVLTVNGEAILSNDSNATITTTGNITANNFIATEWVYGNLGVETQQVQFTDPFGFSLDSVNLLLSDGNLVYESTAGTAGGFVPSADNSETIGRSDRRWATVYANAFIGDGSQLTGLSTSSISNGTSNVTVPSANSNVIINTNGTYAWTFDTTGNLTIPNGGYINFVNTGGITQAVNKDLRFTVSDDEEDGWAIQSTVNDGAGNDLTRMQVRYDGVRINTDLPTNNYNWDFRDTGEFDVPKSIRGPVGGNLVVSIGDQFGSTTFIDLQTRSYVGDALISNIRVGDPNVTVSTASGAYNWTFGGTGNLTLPLSGNIVGATANNNGYLNWFGNSSGDGGGYTTLRLVPDDTRESSDQYLIIDPTAPGHIHIRAGGTQDNSSADLFLGGENSYFKVNAGANNEVRIAANSHVWVFGADGILTVPGEGILRSIGDVVTLQSYNVGTGNVQSVYLGSGGGLGFFDQDIGGNWLEIFRSGAEPQIRVPVGLGNLNIQTAQGNTAYDWVFDNTGNLTTPGNITVANVVTANTFVSNAFNVVTAGNLSITSQYGLGFTGTILEDNGTLELIGSGGGAVVAGWDSTYGNGLGNIATINFNEVGGEGIVLRTGNRAATEYNWNFDNTGNLTLPGNTFSVNYANGTQVSLGGGSYGNADVSNFLANYGSNTIVTTGNITGNTAGYTIGYRDIPQVTFSANATAALTDAGKHYYSTTAGNLALTLPDNSSVAFPTGATLTVVVNAAGNVLVNQGTGVTLYQAGASATGNRVVGAYGLASVMKVAANTWVISGTGVY